MIVCALLLLITILLVFLHYVQVEAWMNPVGEYSECRDVEYDEQSGILKAVCPDADGIERQSKIDTSICKGKKIHNFYGELSCGAVPDLKFSKIQHPGYGLSVYALNKKDEISGVILRGEMWEAGLCEKMSNYYVPGTDMLDIGANMGFSTLGINHYKRITGKVHAFEMQPIMCTILSYNLRNINANIYNCALGDRNDLLTYTLIPSNVGGTPLDEVRLNEDTKNVFVPVIKIDDYLRLFNNQVSLVKIDVEGYEYNVLKGMKAFLQKFKPVIEIELWPDKFAKSSQLLESYGYKLIWDGGWDYIYSFNS